MHYIFYVNYYKIISPEGELLLIHSSSDQDDLEFDELYSVDICIEVSRYDWRRMPITQAEFETYQAFSIKEIKPHKRYFDPLFRAS